MIDLFLIVWLSAVGAVIGSFLNVVIYRVPRGESLVSPPSHCPKCNHRIRVYDNIPIIGWVILGGKCRDCKQPISFRYPMIETAACLIVGTFSVLLFSPDLTFIRPQIETINTSASNTNNNHVKTDMIVVSSAGESISEVIIVDPLELDEIVIRIVWLSIVHLFLLTFGMIEWDGQTLSNKALLIVFGLPIFILMLPFPMQFLYPISVGSIWPFETLLDTYQRLALAPRSVLLNNYWLDAITGFVICGCLALAFVRFLPISNRRFWYVGTTLAGFCFGWQMGVIIVVFASVFGVTYYFVFRRPMATLSLWVSALMINIYTLI